METLSITMKIYRLFAFSALFALLSLLTNGCQVAGGLRTPAEATRGAARGPRLLVLMPDSPVAQQALVGLQDELGTEYSLNVRYVSSNASPSAIGAAVAEVRPRAVVLMNNPTLRLYRRYQVANPNARRMPVIALLTSFLRQSAVGVDNITGVIYEVPLVTSLVNLRDLLDQPLERVGVVHRKSFTGFLKEQQGLARAEGFRLVPIQVSGNDANEVLRAINRLRVQDKVDTIWVLNDNGLLNRQMVRRGWLPALQSNQTPILVNAGSLLSRRVSFGTFAVLPDHRALGIQAANLLTTIAERGWRASGVDLEYPLTVEKVLDINFARQNLALREQRLATIDRLVE